MEAELMAMEADIKPYLDYMQLLEEPSEDTASFLARVGQADVVNTNQSQLGSNGDPAWGIITDSAQGDVGLGGHPRISDASINVQADAPTRFPFFDNRFKEAKDLTHVLKTHVLRHSDAEQCRQREYCQHWKWVTDKDAQVNRE
ncbi:hypothetical protein F53441_5393 [Fusarium austroafricanum]|uniref:Uncharacterized protein n=1 Tax=Fusarium austroafricanum TaxID=2364996 RepID=A0A8H4KL85_9HYPO|nr:hypothetical protein F53441_5393 [Fusarium austroafricanum]